MSMKSYTAVAVAAVVTGTAAAASYSSTGQVATVPVSGVYCTNTAGQVYVRSLVHTVRVQSTDARLTGQRLITLDGGYNTNGTASVQGRSYQQVGTWDPTGTNFVPSSGVWEITYQGLMQTDYSLLLHMAGYGVGGAIDGWRLNETMTRAATSGPMDPTVPYIYSGTIDPPPMNTNLMRWTFDSPLVGWTYYGPAGTYTYTPTNGQLVVRGYWPGVHTRYVVDSYTFGAAPTQTSVDDGQTLEARVELADLSAGPNAARLVLGNLSGFYSIFKGHDYIALVKWSESLPSWGPIIVFFCERVQLPDTGVVLSLSLTRADPNVVLTVRVLSAANPDSVLYQHGAVVDTPNADPVLTSAEFLSLSGMNLVLSTDLQEAPVVSGGAAVGVFQYNDGTQPAAVAAYDNFELWKYDVPRLDSQRAVRLTWPATSMNYGVEAAPTLQGPWMPVQDTLPPGMVQLTVSTSRSAEFFRLQSSP
jgi:hypothetical protein